MRTELTPSWFMAIDWTNAGKHRAARAGNLELRAPIGLGGMGEVWRAYHRARNIQVAVKFLLHDIARLDSYQSEFRREVRAVASLDHPSIIRVLDMGVMGEDVEAATAGRIVAGSPFVAMELLAGGTLRRAVRKPLAWDDLRFILLELLDALAHAHARGVIHRDIKPANLLCRDATNPRAGTVLSDFGIAVLQLEGDGEFESRIGTLAYMAPEQILGHQFDLGPGTDFFALGATAWELLTGAPPFAERKAGSLAAAFARPSKFVPRVDVPPQAETWLQTMLAISPLRRFRSAIEAARALVAIPGAGEPVRHTLPRQLDSPSIEWISNPTYPRATLAGLGLGLYAVRSLPLIGREDECRVLFSALESVVATRESRCVIVRGPLGTGVSRILRFFQERVRELDAALVLEGGLHSGLPRRLHEHFSSLSMPPAKLMERLRRALDDDRETAVEGLALLRDATEQEAATPSVESLSRFLCRLPRQSVLVACFDGVRGNDPTTQTAATVLGHKSPVLFVLGIDQAEAQNLPNHLKNHPRVQAIDLSPLSPPTVRALLEGPLALTPETADRIEPLVGGSPGTATELVCNWIEEGLLQLRGDRIALDDGARVEPKGEPWRARMDRIYDALPVEHTAALSAAAALGVRVDVELWKRIAARCNAKADLALVDQLLQERAIEMSTIEWGRSFRFAHPDAHAALVRRLETRTDVSAIHRACAEELSLSASHADELAVLAAHWKKAAVVENALAAFLACARTHLRALTYLAALRALDELERFAIDAGIPDRDPTRIEGLILRSTALRRERRLDAAAIVAAQAHRHARKIGDPRLHATAVHQRASIAKAQGKLEDAVRWLLEAETQAGETAEPRLRADIQIDLGAVLFGLGHVRRADEKLCEAIAEYDRLSLGREVGMGWLMRGRFAMRRGHRADARSHAAKALSIFRETRARGAIPDAVLVLGDIALHERETASALEHYQAAFDAWIELGSPDAVYAELRMGIALALLDRFEEAGTALIGGMSALRARGKEALADAWQVAMLMMAARRLGGGNWPEYGATALRAVESRAVFDADVAMVAERAGIEASNMGSAAIAELCNRIALLHYTGLGDAEGVARCLSQQGSPTQ